MPLAHFSALASSATTIRLRPGSGSAVCVPPGIRRRPVDVRDQLRVARIAEVVEGQPAVSPCAVAAGAGGQHVVQRHPLARPAWWTSRPAAAVHARHPPPRHDLGLGDRLQIHDAQDVIQEAVEVRGHVRVAPAGPPQPVDAQPRHLQERDLPHLRRLGQVVDAEAGAELLLVGDAVGQRVLEVAAQVVVGLHGDDVGAVGQQHQVLGHLQVVRAREVAAGEEAHGLQPPRVAGVEDREAVAEHVADVEMPPVHHDLHAVGLAAEVAVRQVADAPADALWRHGRLGRGARRLQQRRRGQADERLQVIPPRERAHG